MKKNTWILWAVLFMIPGAAGLGYHFAQKHALQEQIARAAKAVAESATAGEYLRMYEDWHRLAPEQKAESPWGQDPYGGPEIQKRLQEGQANRLTAHLADLDKGIMCFPDELADSLYGPGWQQPVQDYRHQRSKMEMVLIAAVFLLAGSGMIFLGGLGKIAVLYAVARLKRRKEQSEPAAEEQDSGADLPEIPSSQQEPPAEAETDLGAETPQQQETQPGEEPLGYFESRKKDTAKQPSASPASKGSLTELSRSVSPSRAVAEKPPRDSYFGWALGQEEPAGIETLMTTEPLTKELTELTEEVSAIRQFAAQQQDQVRKLQDGYDWMIIRRFCMRIIRSIDNIEDRITGQDDPDSETAQCLEDIRDELVFALESSGIEQFNPELEMPFKGLEKYAEAVRGRVAADNEALSGCIAEIVRPGYQYLISDDDVKIVRCAQVRLYEIPSN